MAHTLILTEKESVAKSFATALSAQRGNGNHYETKDQIITWCNGHLLRLYEPEDYDQRLAKWALSDLPIIPESYEYKPISKAEPQLNHIHSLVHRAGIENIIIATDPGREGELIARLVLDYVDWHDLSSVWRFWRSEALTRSVVIEGLEQAQPAVRFNDLYYKGFYRQLIDWLVGINYSRYCSIYLAGRYNFGRVTTAVLGLVCRRELAIEAFTPEPYYELVVTFQKDDIQFQGKLIRGNSTRFPQRDILLPSVMNNVREIGKGTVHEVKTTEKHRPPAQLLHLTELQKQAFYRFSYTAQQTLDAAQSLYDKHQAISYPRTPSRVMGEADVALVTRIVSELEHVYPDLFSGIDRSLIVPSYRRVFDDGKLEDHHALIPLAPLDLKSATESERNVYELILRSFASAFYPESVHDEIRVDIHVGAATFACQGRRERQMGWLSIWQEWSETSTNPGSSSSQESDFPDLTRQETVKIYDSAIVDKQTKRPRRYSEASLLGAMESPGTHDDAFRGQDGTLPRLAGLGTMATRAAIIEKMIDVGYLRRNGGVIEPHSKGIQFYKALVENEDLSQYTKSEETARWEALLDENPQSFFEEMQAHVRQGLSKPNDEGLSSEYMPSTEYGVCPACGAPLSENKRAYYCKRWQTGCDFKIWKTIANTSLTKDHLAQLLTLQPTDIMTFESKAGKQFEAALQLDTEQQPPKVVFRFSQQQEAG